MNGFPEGGRMPPESGDMGGRRITPAMAAMSGGIIPPEFVGMPMGMTMGMPMGMGMRPPLSQPAEATGGMPSCSEPAQPRSEGNSTEQTEAPSAKTEEQQAPQSEEQQAPQPEQPTQPTAPVQPQQPQHPQHPHFNPELLAALMQGPYSKPPENMHPMFPGMPGMHGMHGMPMHGMPGMPMPGMPGGFQGHMFPLLFAGKPPANPAFPMMRKGFPGQRGKGVIIESVPGEAKIKEVVEPTVPSCPEKKQESSSEEEEKTTGKPMTFESTSSSSSSSEDELMFPPEVVDWCKHQLRKKYFRRMCKAYTVYYTRMTMLAEYYNYQYWHYMNFYQTAFGYPPMFMPQQPNRAAFGYYPQPHLHHHHHHHQPPFAGQPGLYNMDPRFAAPEHHRYHHRH